MRTPFRARGERQASIGAKVLRPAKLAKVVRIVGILHMLKVADVLRDFTDRGLPLASLVVLEIVQLVLSVWLVIHMIGCVWFFVGTDWLKRSPSASCSWARMRS